MSAVRGDRISISVDGSDVKEDGSYTARQREILLRTITLSLICLVSFSIRMFSVLRFESIIHEFDPWFNFRSTKYVSRYPNQTPGLCELSLLMCY